MTEQDPAVSGTDLDAIPAYGREAADVVTALQSNTETGLTGAEAAARLERVGPNEIAQGEAAVAVGGGGAAAPRPDEHHADRGRRR